MEAGERPAVLPRGINAASPDAVAASQRARLLAAMKLLSARDGFPNVTVACLVAEAGVSKPTFYLRFSDKEDSFLQLFDEAWEGLLAAMLEAIPRGKDTRERIEFGLGTLLEYLAADPDGAKVLLIESQRSGAAATARIGAARELLAEVFLSSREALRETNPALGPVSKIRALAAIGAINEPVVATLRQGRAEDLTELRGELLEVLYALSFDAV